MYEINSKNTKNDLFCIDLCKFIMAIVVVAIHTRPFVFKSLYGNKIWNQFSEMAVPFFFLTSGYLFSRKVNIISSDVLFSLRKELLKYLKLYIIWTIIYFPITLKHFIKSDISLISAFLHFVKGFLFIGEQYNSWQLWYLLSSIYAYAILILFCLIKKIKFNNKTLTLILLISFLIKVFLDYLIKYNGDIQFIIIFKRFYLSIFGTTRLLKGIIYVTLGMLFFSFHYPLTVFFVIFCISFLLNLLISNIFINNVLAILFSASFFLMGSEIKLKKLNIWLILRKQSSIIYFFHMYVWVAIYMIIYGKVTYGFFCFLYTVIFTIVISLFFIIIRRIEEKKEKHHISKILSLIGI